ncbi:hypothetical protein [Asanoa sp. NPDC050611]|uniref:hypothetical protein n=1 Tax=Asanoa sp. NPDC050611 TaxID=3157098 RepID=UPI0033D9E74F
MGDNHQQSRQHVVVQEIIGALRPRREPAAPALPVRRAIAVGAGPLFIALLVGIAFIAAFVGALHNPRPVDVPVGVVRGDQAAESLMAAVRAQGPRLLAVDFDSRAAADRALDRHQVYAVLATGGSGLTLTVASAAGPAATTVISAILAAQRAGVPLAVTDAVPVVTDDQRGVVPFYLAVGLVIGGYFGGIALSLALGTVPATPSRAALRMGGLAVHAALLALAGVLIVGPILDIWHRHLPELFGAGLLLAWAAALFAVAVQSWLARIGTALIVLLLVVLGNPGSGGIYSPEFLPGFFRGIHEWDIPGLGADLIRSVIYFPDAARSPAVKLAIWCLGSIIVLLAATEVLGRPRALRR